METRLCVSRKKDVSFFGVQSGITVPKSLKQKETLEMLETEQVSKGVRVTRGVGRKKSKVEGE